MNTKHTPRSTFSLLYYLNKSRPNPSGECPIYLRITLNGTVTAMSIKRSIHPACWSDSGQPVGASAAIKELKAYMTSINAKLYEHHRVLSDWETTISADMLRDSFFGKKKKTVKEFTLLTIFGEFIDKQAELLDKGVSQRTIDRYNLCKNAFSDFLKLRHQAEDILLTKLTKGIVLDFEHYLKTSKGGQNNVTKYLQRLHKVIVYCLDNGWLEKDPYMGIKLLVTNAERAYLTQEELKILMEKEFGIKRLEQVRDMFIFSCYTGLAYIDSKNLTGSKLEKSPDGTMWIRTHRQKTNSRSNVPLLPIPLAILRKYADLENLKPNERVLPLSTNEKMNAYLKEIATLCGINKNFTTHLARHTFATTVTLTNGVPIESVSKMLGHKSIKTTQHYARIVDSKVGVDMAALAEKLQVREALCTTP